MSTVIQGKDAVLQHLEADGLRRSGGKAGVYFLTLDDSNALTQVIIAGHPFSVEGTMALPSGAKLTFEKGIVIEMSEGG